ncbi:Oligopeptide transport ATP-binding protein OppD [Hartmannibacter diazotrophicus]|uniref:Oligopeptide transport ATP-binding protein OppD n=1 Tax=Hartmannibacter diazotrophicus TaxID=1482074 RepID=A0A2C9D689_9HYPH|nr:ABC transporter ATP-binding protein [Hartmannibacter diazotrophicus]SON55035.1 Oligopeptide transport ATP-binding protein OppD [Hartmannibacter diazotrophicus]
MRPPLLSVEGLTLDFKTRHGRVKALEDVSFSVGKGEILGIVGESGSGKSVLSYAVMGLLDAAADIRSGTMTYGGIDLLGSGVDSLRGREISMIFQSPRTALNPIKKVGHQIEDVLVRHGPVPRREARARAIEALAHVRIPDPERRYHAYPFELSGGMCQRVMIAMALACSPGLLIADEPTTGLDVTTQAIVMDLIRALVDESDMGAIVITHDLSLAGEYCDRVMVMHAGHVVETAPTGRLFSDLRHPYTKRLFAATPKSAESLEDLAAIPGNLPDLRGELFPCRFRDRCPNHKSDCDVGPLPLLDVGAAHSVRCHHPEEAAHAA